MPLREFCGIRCQVYFFVTLPRLETGNELSGLAKQVASPMSQKINLTFFTLKEREASYIGSILETSV